MRERERQSLRRDNALKSHRLCIACGRTLLRKDFPNPDAEDAICDEQDEIHDLVRSK